MAERLKDSFGPDVPRRIAAAVAAAIERLVEDVDRAARCRSIAARCNGPESLAAAVAAVEALEDLPRGDGLVRLRVIQRVVQTAAFLALLRGADDEVGDLHQVAPGLRPDCLSVSDSSKESKHSSVALGSWPVESLASFLSR